MQTGIISIFEAQNLQSMRIGQVVILEEKFRFDKTGETTPQQLLGDKKVHLTTVFTRRSSERIAQLIEC